MDIVDRLDATLGRSWLAPSDQSLVIEAAAAIRTLREALRAVINDVNEYERVNNLAPNPGRSECWDSVAAAKAVLAKRE